LNISETTRDKRHSYYRTSIGRHALYLTVTFPMTLTDP